MLRNRRSARNDVAFLDGVVECARQRHRIDALVRVEVCILDGDGRLLQIGRNARQRHDRTPACAGVEGLGEQIALAVEDARALERACTLLQIVGRWQVGGDQRVADQGDADAKDGQHSESQRPAERAPPERATAAIRLRLALPRSKRVLIHDETVDELLV